jgi:lipid-A-disaccharide synthase-like uncharacterized protein
MIDQWREWLYPLGFLSSLLFSSRMLLQWLTSEVRGRSVVMPLFWKLSLGGNLLLALHSLIQVQFHVCLIQVCNAIISWRNFNLMQPIQQQVTFRTTAAMLGSAVCTVFALFWLNGMFLSENVDTWFRIPTTPWQDQQHLHVPFFWHLIGFSGLILFGSRFWIQWWGAEQQKTSYLSSPFWWISLIGESLCLIYFLKIHDPVNSIGPAFGLIPYIRNLMLIYQKQPATINRQ